MKEETNYVSVGEQKECGHCRPDKGYLLVDKEYGMKCQCACHLEEKKCKHGNPKDTNCLGCYNETLSPSDKTWDWKYELYCEALEDLIFYAKMQRDARDPIKGMDDIRDSIRKTEDFVERLLTSATIKAKEQQKKNIGMMRQWLNEDRITDVKKMVSNEDLAYWLNLEEPSK